ncbi:MAG: MFS transporter [Proteiniphilum sp.]|jgi:FHS family L-fucose permease-like MFS transporter|uniref:MFS transporter n=1 Tax=Proteiniphilum sp. TaxID=1926877 RepID=UPI002B1F597D|nr:MFS transporter [Proteiniphilum sp.]MEA5127026.1 MFS transporter [Proteiniphilum sp.]
MNTTTDQNKNRIVPIIMMIALFGMISFVTNLAAPMGQVLKEQFGVSNFMGLLGNAANFIAYAVMGIPGGILLQRVGYKKTALIAIAIGFVGVFVQFLSGHSPESAAFGVYLLGAFIAGFSMCLLNTVVNPMLNTLGGGGNKGNQLIQVGGSFNSIMATFTPMFVGILIGEATKANIKDVFPVMYIAMGVFAVVFFVMMAVRIPEPHATNTKEPMGKLMSGALKFRHFVLGAIAIFVYVGVEVGTPGIMIYWLSDNPEVGKTIAGFVAGTYWFLMLVGRLLGASLGSKISSKTMLSTLSAVGLILILSAILSPTTNLVSLPVLQTSATGALSFGMAQVPINALFIVLVGLCTSIMWGSIFNLAVEGLGKFTPAASGIFMTLVCGGGILPAIQGGVADAAGYIASYWVIVIALAYLLFYGLVGSKNVTKGVSVTDDDEVPVDTASQSVPAEE